MTWGPASDWQDEEGNEMRFHESDFNGKGGKVWYEPKPVAPEPQDLADMIDPTDDLDAEWAALAAQMDSPPEPDELEKSWTEMATDAYRTRRELSQEDIDFLLGFTDADGNELHTSAAERLASKPPSVGEMYLRDTLHTMKVPGSALFDADLIEALEMILPDRDPKKSDETLDTGTEPA